MGDYLDIWLMVENITPLFKLLIYEEFFKNNASLKLTQSFLLAENKVL